jgi:hypothetical protein
MSNQNGDLGSSNVNFNYKDSYERAGYYDFNFNHHDINIVRKSRSGTTTTSGTVVPYRFHPNVTRKLQHFPHAMQEIHMCFDYRLLTLLQDASHPHQQVPLEGLRHPYFYMTRRPKDSIGEKG